MIAGAFFGAPAVQVMREALAGYEAELKQSPYHAPDSPRRVIAAALRRDLERLATTSDEVLPQVTEGWGHDPLLVDLAVAAHMLALSKRQVQRLVADGELVPVHFGRACRIPVEQLRDLIQQRLQEATK